VSDQLPSLLPEPARPYSVTPGSLAGSDWKPPSAGLTELTCPITINDAPDDAGYFVARQFTFEGGRRGYFGIRPRQGGKQLPAFSVFGEGCEEASGLCRPGADGGAGVSCSAWADLRYGRAYNFTIRRDRSDERLWRGIMTDTETEAVTDLGAWRLPIGQGRLSGEWTSSFVEYYKPLPSCSDLPYIDAVLHVPFDRDGNLGVTNFPHEYGRCKSAANVVRSRGPENSARIEAGWKKIQRQKKQPERTLRRLTLSITADFETGQSRHGCCG